MQMNIHLNFTGNAAQAFDFYTEVFKTPIAFKMTYGEGPAGTNMPPAMNDQIMHISMPLGSGLLMACDAPPGRSTPIGGFQVSVEMQDHDEVRRIYTALAEGGSIQMPIDKTFWSPLFGMCTDKFGIGWMIGVQQPMQL